MQQMFGILLFLGVPVSAQCIEMIRIPDKNYEIGKYEVTQKEWREVMGNNPSQFSGCGDSCPVEQVSWNDIQLFLKKLNKKTGKQYRLPIEVEWEYACYGGSKSEYCGGANLDAVGWYNENSGDKTHPVGQKKDNGYGLYDMTGNVSEWMSDCKDSQCVEHVIRSCAWGDLDIMSDTSFRITVTSTERDGHLGFRLARTIP